MKHKTKVMLIGGVGLLAVTGIAFAAKGYQEHRKLHRMFAPAKMLEQIDTDGDKAIALPELNAAFAERFAWADSDGDGSVSKADVIVAIDEKAPVERMKRHSGRITDRLFITADINGDNLVTKAEVENRLAKFHALADWNDDGKVEVSELKRLGASVRGRWGKRWHRERRNAE